VQADTRGFARELNQIELRRTQIPLPAHWEGLSLAWTSVEINRVLGVLGVLEGEIN
jgi:hypothetical protein